MKKWLLVGTMLASGCNAITGIEEYKTVDQLPVGSSGGGDALADVFEIASRPDIADSSSSSDASDTIFEASSDTVDGSVCLVHSNGLGQSYVNCHARGTPGDQSTYWSGMARDARDAWPITGTIQDGIQNCPEGSALLATFYRSEFSSGKCAMWVFQGLAAGHVRFDPGKCLCPTTTDPTWD